MQGRLQTQYNADSGDTGNYIMDKHNIKSKQITSKHWRKTN
jgi:hypothetical protein